MNIEIIIALIIGVVFIIHFIWVFIRHKNEFREHLQPFLNSYGYEIISSKWPGFFKIGPFPKFEIKPGRPQTRIAGIRGEYCEYRIVEFKNSENKIYKLWALLEFEMFKLHRIRWRKESDEIPENLNEILEN